MKGTLTAAILCLSLLPAARAADPVAVTSPAASAVDAEEQLDEGLKRFGYLAGLARGCVVEAQQPALEREALEINAGIARLFGSDRAFLFASSFGYGTNVAVDAKDCPEVVKNYEARVEKFRAGRGGSAK